MVLNSNANLLDEEASKELIHSGLDEIYIGIDAFEPETYAKIRVGGNYEKVVQNTLRLIELKKRMNSPRPEVYVQFVVMDAYSVGSPTPVSFVEAVNRLAGVFRAGETGFAQ